MAKRQNIVIVVDADIAVRDSLKFALEVEGLVVHACSSGTDLLSHPALGVASCIILDHKLPVMDGFMVLEHLALRHVTAPVILLAAHATESVCRRAVAAGVRHVLEKPLLDSQLLDRIHEILAQRPAPSSDP